MRKLFHGYYALTTEESNHLWTNGLIVLDANVLLNIYRYSVSTRETLLNLLEKVKERLWMPYQFAMEFHRRRIDVISTQAKTCSETKTKLKTILDSFNSMRSHATIKPELLAALEEICTVLDSAMQDFESLLGNDKYLTQISSLLENKVGLPPTDEQLDKLFKEADIRIKNKIPPGFEDDGPKTGPSVFGDYVGWAQILEYSKNSAKAVVFVSDDRKNDWWIEPRRGRNIGPRPELLEEFRKCTNQLFYMYTPHRFIEIAGERWNVQITPDTLKEVLDQSASSFPEKDVSSSLGDIHSPKSYGIPGSSEHFKHDYEKSPIPVEDLPKPTFSKDDSGDK